MSLINALRSAYISVATKEIIALCMSSLLSRKNADLEGIYSEIGKSNSLNRSFAICLCNIKKLRF